MGGGRAGVEWREGGLDKVVTGAYRGQYMYD